MEDERTDKLDEIGEKAGRVAMSTLLAASLSAALAEPPRTEQMTLPDPVPIVQMLEEEEEEAPEEEAEREEEADRWERIRRLLKFLLIGLFIVLSILLAVTRGCVSCAAPLITQDEERQEQKDEGQQDAQDEQAEMDEAA